MSTVYVDGQEREVESLTTEQVFYLLQCKPARLIFEQFEEWDSHRRSEAYSNGSFNQSFYGTDYAN